MISAVSMEDGCQDCTFAYMRVSTEFVILLHLYGIGNGHQSAHSLSLHGKAFEGFLLTGHHPWGSGGGRALHSWDKYRC